uniref:Fibronectin type-III domain-containing protein n=1 Tax=Strigamia maritima TaxID=126957 RepID=T1J166_STRMM
MELNGILTGYDITYAKVEGTTVKPEHKHYSLIDQSKNSTKLEGLESNTKYRVTIAALTSQGPGVRYFLEATTNRNKIFGINNILVFYTAYPLSAAPKSRK